MFSDLRVRTLIVCVASMFLLAAGFHYLQNSGALSGGSVPAAKTAWLFTVLFYWYVLPTIWCIDSSVAKKVRQVFGIALLNMTVRAVFELPMMYVTQNWLHAYGIAHDLFSAVLSLVLLLWLPAKTGVSKSIWPRGYFIFSAGLFIMEAVFAGYLRNVTGADGQVFFLPAEASHSLMLGVTVVIVLATWLFTLLLARRWLESR